MNIAAQCLAERPFKVGDWVIYHGSKLRYDGWSMRITFAGSNGRYNLDSGVGVRIAGARPTSIVPDQP